MFLIFFVGCVLLMIIGFLIWEWRAVKHAKHGSVVNAVSSGNIAGVTKFLEKGIDANIRDKAGCTPLGSAALAGSEQMVTLLLDRGAGIDTADGSGWAALHHAASAGHTSIVKLLLERGAAPEPITVKEDFTPLDLAAKHGHTAIFDALAANVAGSKEVSLNFDHEDAAGWSALSRASYEGHVDFVRALIQAGADSNGGKDRTPLSSAVEGERVECATALLDAGAAVEGWRTDGVTPLLEAVSRGQSKMVEFLVGRGSNINARTSDGDTAVILSVPLNNVDLTRMLVDEGGDINGKNNAGESAMSLARKNRNLKVITFLESRHAKG